jgi:glutamate racemase
MPYGGKSCEIITCYARESIEFLNSIGVKLIIAACGTVSTIISKSDLGISGLHGVVEPSCLAAIKASKNLKIGVIGTERAIKSKKYEHVIKKINPNAQVYQKACPVLAPLIENGFAQKNNKNLISIINIYIKPLLKFQIDTLILGCTHYPIIKNTISKVIPKIKLIDSGKETAKFIYTFLKNNNLTSDRKTEGKIDFFVSDLPENFSESTQIFFGNFFSKKQITITKIQVCMNSLRTSEK